MKTQRALLALTVWLTACVPTSTTAYPVPPTLGYPGPATATVAPTAVPTTATPPTETPAPTATTEPEVWEIWFRGYYCGDDTTFCDGPGFVSKYYSIQSDGGGLKEIGTFELPSTSSLSLPVSAPPPLPRGMASPPQLSPDGTHIMYVDAAWTLQVAQLATGQSVQLFDASELPSNIGPFCWTVNDGQIVFFEFGRARELTEPIVYSVATDGSGLKELYTLPGLEGLRYGDCAPNRDEAVVAVLGESAISGLYIVNLGSGEVRRILSRYSAGIVIAAPNQ